MKPTLYITPTMWSKIVRLIDMSDTEWSGFGIAANRDEPCTITDIFVPKQKVTVAITRMDDLSVGQYATEMAKRGYKPDQFMRIWIHTHPGSSPRPSEQDEITFRDCFGKCDWSIMFIVSATGEKYARLQVVKPAVYVTEMDVVIDYDAEYDGTDFEAWEEEWRNNITIEAPQHFGWQKSYAGTTGDKDGYEAYNIILPSAADTIDQMAKQEAQAYQDKEDELYSAWCQGLITDAEYYQYEEHLLTTGELRWPAKTIDTTDKAVSSPTK